MIDRRSLLRISAAAALTTVLGASASFAAERVPFDRDAFDAAVAGGGPVLVDVFAPWCTTCRAQGRVLDGLFGEPRFSAFQVFVVDYDTEKEIMRSFGVQQRSTLIAFSGGAEVGRVIADTRPETISALLESAL